MAQQLNLFDARFAPQGLRFSAQHGMVAVLALLVLTAGSAQGLKWAAARATGQAGQLEVLTAPLQARQQALTGPGGGNGSSSANNIASEITQLRTLEAGQRRISQALNAGLAGAREGPSDYLVALARRASGALWITGFTVDDGGTIALEGRMTDSAVLTDYLKSLNNEPRFKGRPFAQLSLQALDAAGVATPYTEFTLRSAAGGPAGSLAGTAAATTPGWPGNFMSPGNRPDSNNPLSNAVASATGLLASQVGNPIGNPTHGGTP